MSKQNKPQKLIETENLESSSDNSSLASGPIFEPPPPKETTKRGRKPNPPKAAPAAKRAKTSASAPEVQDVHMPATSTGSTALAPLKFALYQEPTPPTYPKENLKHFAKNGNHLLIELIYIYLCKSGNDGAAVTNNKVVLFKYKGSEDSQTVSDYRYRIEPHKIQFHLDTLFFYGVKVFDLDLQCPRCCKSARG